MESRVESRWRGRWRGRPCWRRAGNPSLPRGRGIGSHFVVPLSYSTDPKPCEPQNGNITSLRRVRKCVLWAGWWCCRMIRLNPTSFSSTILTKGMFTSFRQAIGSLRSCGTDTWRRRVGEEDLRYQRISCRLSKRLRLVQLLPEDFYKAYTDGEGCVWFSKRMKKSKNPQSGLALIQWPSTSRRTHLTSRYLLQSRTRRFEH